MDIKSIFPNSINPDSISVYIGRVISLDDNFQDNGYLYVDLIDPDSKDLEEGLKTSNRAIATFALRNLYKCWENPPEIKSKAQFTGSMSMTSSGDFHLRNYCFDMQTLTWFTTVSTALNALGIVNVPPVLVSLDTTPFPTKAVSINVAESAKEVVDEAITDSLKDVSSSDKSGRSLYPRKEPSLDNVKARVLTNMQTSSNQSSIAIQKKTVLKKSGVSDDRDADALIAEMATKIIQPIQTVLDMAFKPYFEFIDCISLLLQIYDKYLDDIETITIPITQFTNINSSTSNASPSDQTQLALKNILREKIAQFKEAASGSVPSSEEILEIAIKAVYEPLAYMYHLITDQIDDIVTPIKNKIVELISTYIKEPLSDLVGFISMSIQPALASLPSIVQLIVKTALKKLLQLILGKPIKFILNKAIEPIERFLDSIVDVMKGKVLDVFEDALNVVIKPVINTIQNEVMAQIPIFSVGSLKEKLTDILEGKIEFPDIYIGTDALKPFKKFVEINWSDPNEIACMLHTLLNDLPIISDLDITPVQIKKTVESLIKWTGAGGILKKFDSLDDLMPLFEGEHLPVMTLAKLGEGMFKEYGESGSKTPDKWITNNVTYVTDDKDNKYIVALEDDVSIPIYYPDSEEIGMVDLKKGHIYETEEVIHIKQNTEDNPSEGNDLVPKIDLIDGDITPRELRIQKTVVSGKDTGKLLYYTDSSKTKEDTYDNIITSYIEPKEKIETESLDDVLEPLAEAFINKINGLIISGDSSASNHIRIQTFLSSNEALEQEYVKTLKDQYESKSGIMIEREDREGDDIVKNVYKADATQNRLFTAFTNNNKELSITLRDGDSGWTNNYTGDDYRKKISITLTLYRDSINSKFTSHTLTYRVLYREDNPGFNNEYSYRYRWYMNGEDVYPQDKAAFTLSFNTSVLFYDTDNLYIKINQEEVESVDEVVAIDMSEPTKVENKMAEMTVNTVNALGISNGFSASALFNSLGRSVMSGFSALSDTMSGVTNTILSTIEGLDEVKKIDDLIEPIKTVGDKVQEVSDTAKPALEATAKAASAVAIQSCSMTQSASGKDFSFTSGSNYDLSTTTDSQLQLPYCKELKRESLLEPNCKVLVLAVGAGKQNLYVMDILS